MKILFKLNPFLQQRQKEKARWIFPIKLAMYATYLRNHGHQIVWDGKIDESVDKIITSENQIDVPFLELPAADRILTDAKNKKWQENGNFKYHPGTYIQSASSCWWGKCEFCVEKNKSYEIRHYLDVWGEIDECERLGFKEIFDDSGTFPTGEWLENFLDCVPYGNPVLGCNMRLVDAPYEEMKNANFRMILFGIESANQKTLDRISKGTKEEDIRFVTLASQAGLDCHGAFMFGYPWETDEDVLRTLALAHRLLQNGVLKTAQASFYMPPDGKNNLSQKKYVNKLYDVKWNPEFLFNQLKDIKDWNDVKYLWKKISSSIRK